MFRYQVSRGSASVEVSLPTEEINERSPLIIEGDADLVERLRADLAKGYGAFGHLFKLEATTAIDLDYALKALPEYGIEIVEGEALLNEYDPEISDNSVT